MTIKSMPARNRITSMAVVDGIDRCSIKTLSGWTCPTSVESTTM